MKLCFIIIDGLGDGFKDSILEEAYKPNLDELASKSKCGLVMPIKGIAPQSDAAIFSLFGYDITKNYPGRGAIEVIGANLNMKKGFLAMRTNFATIEGNDVWNAKLIDRRCGRTLTTNEAKELEKVVNKCVDIGKPFIFKCTVEHRGVLIIKDKFSEPVTNTDGAYKRVGNISVVSKHGIIKAKGKGSEYVNRFVEESFRVLNEHEVNKQRVKKKLLPANVILTRDASVDLPHFELINIKTNKTWGAVVGMPLEKGIANTLGMHVYEFDYPEIKTFDVYKHLYDSLKMEISQALNYFKHPKEDAVWLHFKELDIPGHDGNREEKIKMLEFLDKKFFSIFIEKLEEMDIRVIVTSDHATPCTKRKHTSDAVPVIVYGNGKDNVKCFSENFCKNGSLKILEGKDIIRFLR